MEIDDTGGVISALLAAVDGIECWQVHTFVMERRNSEGTEMVDVQVRDRGPGAEKRYQVSATGPEGRDYGTVDEDDLTEAIAALHWS